MRTSGISLAVLGVLCVMAAGAMADPATPITVTARLVDIPGKLPPDDLYDYAYVMKYEAVGGEHDKAIFLVAHYKPRQHRAAVNGKMKKVVSGTLKSFRQDDVHALTLVPHTKDVWRGAMVDDYFAKDRKTQRYWCLRVDPATAK